jgi:hypothetical protein
MIGAVLDFKERTITIDEIFLPKRNINNLQLKPSISRALKLNSSFAQEPASTHYATKRIEEILDSKYDKADLPSIVKNNWAHLNTPLATRYLHCSLSLRSSLMARSGTGNYRLSPLN